MINDPKDSAYCCSAHGCSADGGIAQSCSAHSSKAHGCREHSFSESVTKLFSDTVNESELPDELKLADITATFENDNPTE